MDDFALPKYVDGAEEVLSAIAEIPGIEFTVVGSISKGPPEKGLPVRLMAKKTPFGAGDILMLFSTPSATQIFTIMFCAHVNPYVLVDRVAACIRSFGRVCTVSTVFLSESPITNDSVHAKPRRLPIPFYPPMGEPTMATPNGSTPPPAEDLRKKLSRAGCALNDVICGTPGVSQVKIDRVSQNLLGDVDPVITRGNIIGRLLVTCYTPTNTVAFKVDFGGATEDELRRRLMKRIADVDVRAIEQLDNAVSALKPNPASLPPQPPTPPAPPTPAAAKPAPVTVLPARTKRQRARSTEWDEVTVKAIKCLQDHAVQQNGILQVDAPYHWLNLMGLARGKAVVMYQALQRRGVLDAGKPIGAGKKRYVLSLPTIPDVTWNSQEDSSAPTPPAPSPPTPTPAPAAPQNEAPPPPLPPISTERITVRMEGWVADGLEFLMRESHLREPYQIRQVQYAIGALKEFYQAAFAEQAVTRAEEAFLFFRNNGIFIPVTSANTDEPRKRTYWIANVEIVRWESLIAFAAAVDRAAELEVPPATPTPPLKLLSDLSEQELRDHLLAAYQEVKRRGADLMLHNGTLGVFSPLNTQPTESS